MTLVVSEIFGPTIQGEGRGAGTYCGFLRLMACNLSCSWCDTPYTWDASRYNLKEEGTTMEVDDIMARLKDMKIKTLILTGGEPLLSQKRQSFKDLLIRCDDAGIAVNIETNGTLIPSAPVEELVSVFAVSPKLAHGGDAEDKRIKPDALAKFATLARQGRAFFKFVAQQPSDFVEVDDFIWEFDLPANSIWIMPEGVTPERQLEVMRDLTDSVLERGWNLSPRIHVLIWGNRRGV